MMHCIKHYSDSYHTKFNDEFILFLVLADGTRQSSGSYQTIIFLIIITSFNDFFFYLDFDRWPSIQKKNKSFSVFSLFNVFVANGIIFQSCWTRIIKLHAFPNWILVLCLNDWKPQRHTKIFRVLIREHYFEFF